MFIGMQQETASSYSLFWFRVCDPTSIGEENETFFIRVRKPLPSRRVLKTLRRSPKGKAQRGQYLLAVGLGCYKWYQSQTQGGVPARTLSPEGGVDFKIPRRLERETSASKDVGLQRGVDFEIPYRLERERNIIYKGVETSP